MQHLCRYLVFLLVLGLLSACGNDDDKYYMVVPPAASQGGGEDVDPTEPPVPPVPGSAVISLKGGDGVDGPGGSGGHFIVNSYGDVLLSRFGSVDASFDLPDHGLQIDLGEIPFVVSGSVSIPLFNVPATAPTAGIVYMVSGYSRLFLSDGTGDVVSPSHAIITGMQVQKGAELILPLNFDSSGGHNDGQDYVNLDFDSDVLIDGRVATLSLTSADPPIDSRHGGLAIVRDKGALLVTSAGAIILGPDAYMDLEGGAAVIDGERGGDGGAMTLSASGGLYLDGDIAANGGLGLGAGDGGNAGVKGSSIVGISFSGMGMMVNQAQIDLYGGSGSVGGQGGGLNMFSAVSSVYNSDDIIAVGGNSRNGFGASGGQINFSCMTGGIYNSGDLLTAGGDGSDNGGNAGSVAMHVGGLGNVYNSGNLDFSGGDCTADGHGGWGANLSMLARGGDLLCSGDILAQGGIGNGTGHGGKAGNLTVQNVPGMVIQPLAAGRIAFSGNLELMGGNGDEAQSGGIVQINNAPLEYTDPMLGPVEFLGYRMLDVSGGSGSSGASAGIIQVVTMPIDGFAWASLPSIDNEIDFIATGGIGSFDEGGAGGQVMLRTEGPLSDDGARGIDNSGSINISGGSGQNFGGAAGVLDVWAYDFIDNSGAIAARGGDCSTFVGGAGGIVHMIAAGVIENSADINAAGGSASDGDASGGSASVVQINAGIVGNGGSIWVAGGHGRGAGSNGDGGQLMLVSTVGSTSNSAPLLSVAAGNGGAVDGTVGMILIDNTDITPTDGTLP